MSRRGRPKHTYEVSYHELAGCVPTLDCPEPWHDGLQIQAQGDVVWAAAAMGLSTSYLRLLLSARRGEPITSVVVFKGCRLEARLRRVA